MENQVNANDSKTEVILGECLGVMRGMEPNSVDLILTDPPYFRVKNEAWDRQWDDAGKFLEWMGLLVTEWHRILRPNGSLYVFASPKMAARVEVEIGKRFNVLNHIVWPKSDSPTSALKYGDDRFRQYVLKSERIIFAEHYGADNIAKGESGYGGCNFIFEPIRAYLDSERSRSGMTKKQVDEAWCKHKNVSQTAQSQKWFTDSCWNLPTESAYEWLKSIGIPLSRQYAEITAEHERLQIEYESLRRPFSVTADVPFTDVWEFKTVNHYKGKHPCEKPADLLEHIIKSSSREGATVLDCFMGTGSTGLACKKLGRNFIGIELSPEYCAIAQARLDATKSP